MRGEVRIICADETLGRLLTLLLEGEGYGITSKPTSACPLIIDADSAELPRDKKYSAIIALSRNPDGISAALRSKCRTVLRRPFEFCELSAAVEDALNNAGKHIYTPPRSHKIPAITLREADRILFCGAKQIKLTPAEAAIFILLSEHRGDVVSYDMLSAALGESNSNKPEVHMCALRRKISEICPAPLIKNVRGQGYLMK
ncbi:MAG: helix-turn-helix domain-containing protein [Clostridia bacterium]|nr:helix-turn-helix domain-containing protein [Clostridia bacterium]